MLLKKSFITLSQANHGPKILCEQVLEADGKSTEASPTSLGG